MEIRAEIHRDEYTEKFGGRFPALECFVKDFDDISPPLSQLGTPSDGRFAYPTHQRRNRVTTEAMRRVEQNLDLFWSTIDAHLADKSPRLKGIESLMSERRQFQRTPEWVEPIIRSKDTVELTQPYIPLGRLDLTDKDTVRFTSPTIPHKVKTRGTTSIKGTGSGSGLEHEPVYA